MKNWFLSLSIRWKLQIGFFLVTMITTVYNRILAAHELGSMVEIARRDGVAANVIEQLEANHSAYIFNSFWESGIEFVVQFFIIGAVATVFVRPIQNLCQSLLAVEKGDLTKGVAVTSRDELGVLEQNFNSVLNSLNHIMRQIDANGKEMEQSAFQIAKISHEITEVSRLEHSRSAEVSMVTEQLQSASADVQQQAHGATERAKKTEERARDGIRMVQKNISEMESTTQEVHQAVEKISELEQASSQIHAIIASIQAISTQTNLLALNAAIEAARAGEQGRGFSVVADEVRKLAERTSGSAKQVSDIISELGGKVQMVTASMNIVVEKVHENQRVAAETASVIEHMAGEVAETAKANDRISLSSGNQIENVNLLQNSLAQLFDTLRESSVKVETTAAIGQGLHQVTSNLNALIAGFTFNYMHAIAPKESERRKLPRIDNKLLVHVTQGNTLIECSSVDLSLKGLRLRLNQKLNDKQPVALKIFLPHENLAQYEQQTPVELTARVNWQDSVDGINQCGMAFDSLSPDASDKIRECFKYFHKLPEFEIKQDVYNSARR